MIAHLSCFFNAYPYGFSAMYEETEPVTRPAPCALQII